MTTKQISKYLFKKNVIQVHKQDYDNYVILGLHAGELDEYTNRFNSLPRAQKVLAERNRENRIVSVLNSQILQSTKYPKKIVLFIILYIIIPIFIGVVIYFLSVLYFNARPLKHFNLWL